jgi:hypothetical protein
MDCLAAKLYVIQRQPLPARGYSVRLVGVLQSGELELATVKHFATFAEANAVAPRNAQPVSFHRGSEGVVRLTNDKDLGVFVQVWVEWCPLCNRKARAKAEQAKNPPVRHSKASA